MNANERKYLDSILEKVIGCAYEVSNVLGSGFLEKIYERALARELSLSGLKVRTQARLTVSYKGHCVGNYLADLVVENCVMVELKCVEAFSNEHTAQCINYLRASGLKIALLINFQRPKVEWKRIVLGL
jgi:GxxExxY protein